MERELFGGAVTAQLPLSFMVSSMLAVGRLPS